jgi:RNA polymerase sigma factor (sigma-70 family)
MARGQLMARPTGMELSEEQTDRQLLERFTARKDEGAFAVLVRRHGPMVLGVCRRILGNAHDADDAFQATFLVLARRARDVGRPELLGNWLYGVAYRISLKAKSQASRRSQCEKQAATMYAGNQPADSARQELRLVLTEEIERLPEKYRAPVVLCYLQGKTNEEAASEIGCPPGSMSWRLARARELLRQRLKRCGAMLPVGGLSTALAEQAAGAAVPDALLEATVRGAVRTAAAGASASSAAAALAEAMLRELTAQRFYRRLTRVLIALLLVGGTVGLVSSVARAFPDEASIVIDHLPSFSGFGETGGGCHP